MRVCFITFEYPPKIIGGMGIYAEQLVKGMVEKGVDVSIITRGNKTGYYGKTYLIKIPDILYWRRFLFIKYAIDLFHRLNRAKKFDLVHLNGTYPIARCFGLPTICTLHAPPNLKQIKMLLRFRKFRSVNDITYLLLKNPVGAFCDFTTTRISNRIICPSPSLAEDFLASSMYFVDREKVSIIPNGIDLQELDRIESSDASLLESYEIKKGNFILYMGRLSFIKGVSYLIEAFKIVQKKHKDLKLAIVGRGDSEPYLRRMASSTKGIVFLGYVNSAKLKKLLIEASLCVVLPSPIYEISPMIVLEAMGCSKPVIATNVGGNPYFITHGKNGLLSKPRDSERLADLIDMICEKKAWGKKMGMHGRKIVEEKFTLTQMVDETLKTYVSSLNEHV